MLLAAIRTMLSISLYTIWGGMEVISGDVELGLYAAQRKTRFSSRARFRACPLARKDTRDTLAMWVLEVECHAAQVTLAVPGPYLFWGNEGLGEETIIVFHDCA